MEGDTEYIRCERVKVCGWKAEINPKTGNEK
jgi:hypothetical protein